MASFRTHLSFGIAAGVVMAVLTSIAVISQAPSFLVCIFASCAIGAILPDMDSDSGIPLHLAFSGLTAVTAWVAFEWALKEFPKNFPTVVLITGIASALMWFGVGTAFKRWTIHRGMAHSIPAAILSGLVTFYAVRKLPFKEHEAFLLSLSLIVGYLVHLILDEIWAGVNFHGRLFKPNKAFGSALKLYSNSHYTNLAVYGLIIYFIYIDYAVFFRLFSWLGRLF